MKPRSAATAVVFLLAIGLAAGIGRYLGGPYGRDATRRGVEVQTLPIGSAAQQIELDLPALAPGPVKNVVLLIGDGMGIAQIDAARLAMVGPDGRLVLDRFPIVGLAATGSVGAPIAESAASGTALATGVATTHGRVGTAPDGRKLVTLLEAARDAGLATGLITTSMIVDATPAAFATHVAERKEEAEIALELAEARVDLLIGGGREQFQSLLGGGRRRDQRDLLAEAEARGVTIASTPQELAAARSLPLWALVPGRLDQPGDDAPLADWAERGVALLAAESERRRHGFFLMIEEEGIDSAGHANDFTALVRAVTRLDAATAAVARFAARDGATLVLVTGDHTTGGLTIDFSTDAEQERVAWSSAHHGGEQVPVYAYGPADAQSQFSGSYHQQEIARRLAPLLGLDLSANWKGAS